MPRVRFIGQRHPDGTPAEIVPALGPSGERPPAADHDCDDETAVWLLTTYPAVYAPAEAPPPWSPPVPEPPATPEEPAPA